MKEAVNNPEHYGGANNPYEAIKVIDAWGLDFHLGNAVKYISRAGKKNSMKEIEDLQKAEFYIKHKIKLLQEKEIRLSPSPVYASGTIYASGSLKPGETPNFFI
jgi:hypothetical protein